MKKSLNFYFIPKLIVCFIFTVFLVSIRTYQIINFVDYRTGFYNGPDYLNYCFFGGIILLILILIVFSFFWSNDDVVDLSSNLSLKVILFFVAIFSALYSIFIVLNVKYYDIKDMTIPILLFIANILLSIGFVYLAFKIGKSGDYGSYSDIFLLFPVLWVCIRLISIFLNNMIMFSVQENTLNVLKTCSICIFLFCMSKFFAGFSSKTTNKNMIVTGFLSVCLIWCSALPRYISSIITCFMKHYYLNVSDLVSLDFFLSIFILVFLFSYILRLKK